VTRVLLVDDEPLALASLEAKVLGYDPTFEVALAGDPHDALAKIRTWRPAVVLLDIQMPGMSGLDLLRHLEPADRGFALIFCTAHDEHAVRAFAEAAIDYLLKPVEPERLSAALDRALRQSPPWSDRLPSGHLQRLAVRTRKGVAVVSLDSVLELASEQHETVLYTATTEYVSDLSLAELETKLDPAAFFRCHRAHIINVHAVKAIDDATSTVLVGPRTVPLARRRKAELLSRLR
jgi:two-component system LytT family response regulator